jgi:hypothetical protein
MNQHLRSTSLKFLEGRDIALDLLEAVLRIKPKDVDFSYDECEGELRENNSR